MKRSREFTHSDNVQFGYNLITGDIQIEANKQLRPVNSQQFSLFQQTRPHTSLAVSSFDGSTEGLCLYSHEVKGFKEEKSEAKHTFSVAGGAFDTYRRIYGTIAYHGPSFALSVTKSNPITAVQCKMELGRPIRRYCSWMLPYFIPQDSYGKWLDKSAELEAKCTDPTPITYPEPVFPVENLSATNTPQIDVSDPYEYKSLTAMLVSAYDFRKFSQVKPAPQEPEFNLKIGIAGTSDENSEQAAAVQFVNTSRDLSMQLSMGGTKTITGQICARQYQDVTLRLSSLRYNSATLSKDAVPTTITNTSIQISKMFRNNLTGVEICNVGFGCASTGAIETSIEFPLTENVHFGATTHLDRQGSIRSGFGVWYE